MSETKTLPAVEQAPATQTVPTSQPKSGIYLGTKPCNLFFNGVPLKDEYGRTMSDPTKVELKFQTGGDTDIRIRIKTNAVPNDLYFGDPCHFEWNTLDHYNNGEPFVEMISKMRVQS